MSGFSVALRYDSEHPQFARGIEIGRVWGKALHQMEVDGRVDLVETIHGDAAEMVMRIAEYLGVAFSAEYLDTTNSWVEVSLEGPGHE